MLMIKTRSIFLSFCLMFLLSGIAIAKNNQLQDDMVALERVYISALALTSAKSPFADNAMVAYETEWAYFIGEYKYYQTGYRKWISYFNAVDGLISHARTLINEDELLEAHEVLEAIRTTMEDFRGQNGFPRFIADDFTAFHSIMGEIIGIAGKEFDDHTLDIFGELYIEASQAWVKVENNPVVLYEWYFMDENEVNTYNDFITFERDALDNFKDALSSGTEAAVKQAAFGLKPNQAKAYLMLSTLPKPQP